MIVASYLSGLRENRVGRPCGSREQHESTPPSRQYAPTPPPRQYAPTPPSRDRRSIGQMSRPQPISAQQEISRAPSVAASSVRSRYSIGPNARDYYHERSATPLQPSEVVPTATYMERGQRWMEKEEACSLRQAMDDMQVGDVRPPSIAAAGDQRLYEAALNEASELVWQHQNPCRPPPPDAPYRYRPHLRKNSYAHARTASVGIYGDEIVASGLARDSSRRPMSGSSDESTGVPASPQHANGGVAPGDSMKSADSSATSPSKSFGGIGNGRPAVPNGPRQSTSQRGKRNISGEVGKPFTVDQIWEEPEAGFTSKRGSERGPSPVLESKGKNPLNRVHFSPPKPNPFTRRGDGRDSPSRSRDPLYMTNPAVAARPPSPEKEDKIQGVEIRGDDIRQATSVWLKDRSNKLPTPSAVSDNPGRPIVSFDASWTPPDHPTDRRPERSGGVPAVAISTIVTDEEDAKAAASQGSGPVSSISVDAGEGAASPTIPTIHAPSPPIPSINADDSSNDGGVPIVVMPGENHSGNPRPLPQPGKTACRARPARPPSDVFPHGTSLCNECGFPLQGRFVALANSAYKFHPQCLACFVCGTSLEALEISPEPDSSRQDRLERIQRRAAGEALEEIPGKTMTEDGDDRFRLYCHLDWHELFAPRCKHCRTPILGEHIVALGHHWHYGHFFCAECGDPFEHGMTHIEKDGHAWCIKCQTKRTERRAPKCKMCKVPVVGQYIQALGGEWHEACFRCAYCSGGFDDGQIFPTESASGSMIVLCTGCRMRDLKR